MSLGLVGVVRGVQDKLRGGSVRGGTRASGSVNFQDGGLNLAEHCRQLAALENPRARRTPRPASVYHQVLMGSGLRLDEEFCSSL